MRTLYPEIKVNQTYMLDVGDGHTLYVEESGNPEGIPVIHCHGGPGGGSSPTQRRFYDPEKYRIILFDQRGCGQSTPLAATDITATWNNTISHIIRDMETIRDHLSITRWVVTGGSWGTTVALLYAIRNPAVVQAIILRGVFLGRQQDLNWLFGATEGASQIFPEYYAKFIKDVPSDSVEETLEYYKDKLMGDNDFEQLAAAKKFGAWEANMMELNYHLSHHDSPHKELLTMAILYCHYFTNHCFIYESEILSEIAAIQHIPGYIVHGRNDVICKPEGAFVLNSAWTASVLEMVPAAGHASVEPGIVDGLIRASQKVARFINEKK
ncbi:prolyl aminopeptidase [Psychrosphaera aestuarii]|uniref:prolyl aminopeptidase n=1 Tax=Psychrosphaera aestuarii TaxID=1266052 RepID=UPI001B34562F|nr:prolyl aminopeptidase [Psychrosphaera aestuarii]